MYLYIPLGIFAASLLLIVWVVTRKFVYLKKLSPDALKHEEANIGFWKEMYPEIAVFWKRINLRQYAVNALTEIEKNLRKLRLVSSKIDTSTSNLINKVRKSTKKQEAIISKVAEEVVAPIEVDPFDLGGDSKEELKKKEQYLIIEIAKNPKDALLYKELGSLYMRTGELEDAKQSFERSLELEADDETTKRKLGRVLAKLEEKK